jgi:hypothetical protein
MTTAAAPRPPQVFRQSDTRFVDLLNEMRRGALSPFHVSQLQFHCAESCRAEAEASRGEAEAPHGQVDASHGQAGSSQAAGFRGRGHAMQMAAAGDAADAPLAPPPPRPPSASPPAAVKPQPAAVKLFAQNGPADVENERRLSELTAPQMVYEANESPPGKMDGCLAPVSLHLKLGATVSHAPAAAVASSRQQSPAITSTHRCTGCR